MSSAEDFHVIEQRCWILDLLSSNFRRWQVMAYEDKVPAGGIITGIGRVSGYLFTVRAP